jgi:hypothetical protein
MYPQSINMKHTPRDYVKREYHKVQLTWGLLTWKVNETKDGQLRLKIPLNIYHGTMVTWQQDKRVGRI